MDVSYFFSLLFFGNVRWVFYTKNPLKILPKKQTSGKFRALLSGMKQVRHKNSFKGLRICKGARFLLFALVISNPLKLLSQDMSFDVEELPEDQRQEQNDANAQDEAVTLEESSDDLIENLASDDSESTNQKNLVSKSPKWVGTEAVEEIYAVQQIYALRLRRFELSPFFGATIADPYVDRLSLGASFNYWFTDALAVGGSFLWYEGLESESDLSFHIRRSTYLSAPVTEWQLGAHINFTYVPFYGKFAMFNKYIFEWDAYLVGGVGIMRTRPIAVIDPEIRSFDYGIRAAFNVGLGLRVFVTRFLSVFAEFRDYIHLENYENEQVAIGLEERQNKKTWLTGSRAENNFAVQVGISMFLPFTFEYRQPK